MDALQESVLNNRLKNLIIYKELERKCLISPKYAEIITFIQRIGEYSLNKSKTIIKNMPEFTLHDQEHIFHMLYIAGKLIPKETLQKLSIPDLMMIIASIFLHDIGMCPDEDIIKAWKNQLPDPINEKYQEEINKFKRFRQTFTQEIDDINSLNKAGEHSKAQILEDRIVTEYIRINHAERARTMIASDWEGKIKYLDTDLTADLAEICFSHNESYTFLLSMETMKLCDEDTYLCFPFVAVILRLADIIDFDPKRTPPVLFSHLAIENPISLQEWHKHIAINAWTITSMNLVFSAQCSHPAIEATILQFCDLIDNELRNCTLVLANLNSDFIEDISHFRIPLPAYVDRRKIKARKDIATGKPIYRYHDTKFTLSKRQVVDLLMGTKLYGKPEVALRELIQNSIDACLLRQRLSEIWNDNYKPNITVSFYTENDVDYLRVSDNGIGMNQHIIDNYYTNIGRSYYTSTEFYDLIAEIKCSFKPISRFGIGILACFMVCDNMEVNTRKVVGQYQYDAPLKITIEGYDSIFIITDSERREPGTDTKLKLRKMHPWQKMSKSEFIECVQKLIPLPPFEIFIETEDIQKTYSPEAFEELDLNLNNDYTWKEEDNIRIIDINLNSLDKGFRGKASVAFIVNSKNTPVSRLEISSKDVYVENEIYSLSSSISYGINCIRKNTSSLEVNEDGEIESNDGFREITKSKSFLSIHGIDVPCSLFSDYMNYGQKSVLHFPFPIRLRLDVGGSNDLNLNSARTQIIYDDTWLQFEKDLFETVCIKIKEAIGPKMWANIKAIFVSNMKDAELSAILEST